MWGRLTQQAACGGDMTGPAVFSDWAEPWTVTSRRGLVRASTHRAELLTCQLEEETFEVLCKMEKRNPEQADRRHRAHGHRGGVPYEAAVYAEILADCRAATPRYFGYSVDKTWAKLYLEFISGGTRLSECVDWYEGLEQAASWLAAFHDEMAVSDETRFPRWLTRYDHAYYKAWVCRASNYVPENVRRKPWFEAFVLRSDHWIDRLCGGPKSLVHGEFYPENLLVTPEGLITVDWESAALAHPCIDVVALLDGLSPESAADAQQRYVSHRGIEAESFAAEVAAARIYLLVRWLGDRMEWSTDPEMQGQIDALRMHAEESGVV